MDYRTTVQSPAGELKSPGADWRLQSATPMPNGDNVLAVWWKMGEHEKLMDEYAKLADAFAERHRHMQAAQMDCTKPIGSSSKS